MTTRRGNVLRIFDDIAFFENLETGNCLISNKVNGHASANIDLKICKRLTLDDIKQYTRMVIQFDALFGIYELLRSVLFF